MKTLILFLLLCFGINAYSQKTEWLFGISKDSCQLFADNVISKLNGDFAFAKQLEFTEDNANYYEVTYQSKALSQQYSVLYQKFNNRFYPVRLEGKFTELLPIWQQYIEPGSTAEGFNKKLGAAKNIDNPANPKKYVRCVFKTQNAPADEWYINFQYL